MHAHNHAHTHAYARTRTRTRAQTYSKYCQIHSAHLLEELGRVRKRPRRLWLHSLTGRRQLLS